MKQVAGLAALGAAFFLLSLLMLFPADLAIQWFAPDSLRAAHVRGTVWSGSAAAAAWNELLLGETKWQLKPLSLLRGRVAFQVSASRPGTAVEGLFAASPFGNLHAKNIRLRSRLSTLASVLPDDIPTGMFDGDIDASFKTLHLEDGWPETAEGTVGVASLLLINPPEPLGDYQIEFGGGAEGGPNGVFRDLSGPLAINGSVTFNSDRTFAVQCTGEARAGASNVLQSALVYICPPGDAG